MDERSPVVATIAWLSSLPVRACLSLLALYRLLVAPALGPCCRFSPSCSHYASEALRRHGALAGGWLTLRRLGRCHPWGGSGHDPVPEILGGRS